MPRNSRNKAIAAAAETLASSIIAYEKAHPGPSLPILARLKALFDRVNSLGAAADDITMVLAFARVAERLRDLDDQLIPLLIEARQLHQGGSEDDKRALGILDAGRAALPHVMKAMVVLRLYRTQDGNSDNPLQHDDDDMVQIARTLDLGAEMIRSKLEMTAPVGSRRHAAGLRYFVTMIDVYGYDLITDEKARSPDIAKLAQLALGVTVTDKMVSSLRERR
jgi:hypothetical protein